MEDLCDPLDIGAGGEEGLRRSSAEKLGIGRRIGFGGDGEG